MIPIGVWAPLDFENFLNWGGGGGNLHTHAPGLYTSNVTLYFSHGL